MYKVATFHYNQFIAKKAICAHIPASIRRPPEHAWPWTTRSLMPPRFDPEKERLMNLQAKPEQGFEQWETGLYLTGKALLDSDRENEAFSVWLAGTEEGHSACQNGIGWMYQHGVAVESDLETALAWYLKAAHQGNPKAMFNAALFHDEGWGLDQEDDLTAAYWYDRAAQAGYPDACLNLGLLYLFGSGVEENAVKANSLFEQAALLGNSDAAYNLGRSYYLGRGIESDEEKAAYWYERAAADGHAWASYLLALLYFDGMNGNAPDHGRAVPLMEAAATVLPQAMNYMANLYEHGDILEQDLDQAFNLYLAAAERGLADGMYNVAALFTLGKGTEANYGAAAYWFENAWENGDAEASKQLAYLYTHGGPNLAADLDKAAYWERLAIKN